MKQYEEMLSKEKHDIEDLKNIMAILRSEEGCPWDREQTHSSIRQDFIEETYEAIEAIDKNDSSLLREELGDVLLQIIFHSRIEEEAGNFTFDDVVNDICKKLIHRHPHVFGDAVAADSDTVLNNWDKIKKEEKKERDSVTMELRSVPPSLPALMRAQKIGKRAGKAGFDFKDAAEAMEKVHEEVAEVTEELEREEIDKVRMTEEIGDLLLAVTNVARFTGVDCEIALGQASDKFIRRFEGVENMAKTINKSISDMSDEELLTLWNAEKCKNR